jgi:hypothetical protein
VIASQQKATLIACLPDIKPKSDRQLAQQATSIACQDIKGIDRPFRGWVKISLIRSLFINWRLGNFFSSHFKGISS